MTVLDTLLSISVYAAVLFCCIMLFKKFAKNRISPVLQFALWFILIARLMIPFTVESGFHLVSLPVQQGGIVEKEQTPAVQNGGQTQQQKQQGTEQNIQNPAANGTTNVPVAVPEMTPVQNGDDAQIQPQNPAAHTAPQWKLYLSAEQIILLVWLIGAGIVAGVMCAAALGMNRRLRKGSVLPDTRLQRIFEECIGRDGMRPGLKLRLCAGLTTPALTVSFRPKLLLPLDLFSAEEQVLRYAMIHELTHWKRKDYLIRILMNVLKAVWWFNPVVWIADRQMIMDMESACDSMVVRNMESTEKKLYAATILEMFTYSGRQRYILGMAMGNTKKVAEKRIRGIYMKSKTKRGMKFAAVLLAAVLAVACFTTACTPMPREEASAPKVEPFEASAEGPTAMVSDMEEDPQDDTPLHIEKELALADTNVTLKIDADVERLQDDTEWNRSTAVREIAPREFTQEDQDKVEAALKNVGAQIDENGVEIIGSDGEMIRFQGVDGVEGVADGKSVLTSSSSEKSFDASTQQPWYEDGITYEGNARGLTATLEQAQNQAIQIAQEIDPDFKLAFTQMVPVIDSTDTESEEIASKKAQDAPQVYRFDFTRTVDGFQETYTQNTAQITLEQGNEWVVFYEKLSVMVDDTGVTNLYWQGPQQIGDAIRSISPISAEQAIEALRANIMDVNYSMAKNSDAQGTIKIDRITLGYARVTQDDGIYRLMPVWDFFGTNDIAYNGESLYQGHIMQESPVYSLLTINAEDGSVVDRAQAPAKWETAEGIEQSSMEGLQGVKATATVAPPQTQEGKFKFTFTLENGTDKTLEKCALFAPPLKDGGQMGNSFTLEPGERKIMTWSAKEADSSANPEFRFTLDGEEQYIGVSLGAQAAMEMPAPATPPNPTPTPTPTPRPTPQPSAEPMPAPTPTPTPRPTPQPTPTPSAAP